MYETFVGSDRFTVGSPAVVTRSQKPGNSSLIDALERVVR